MGHIVGISIGIPSVGVAIVVAVAVAAMAWRLYLLKHPGMMRAKCPKCSAVYDAGAIFSSIHIGPLRHLKCPACGKSSFTNAYVKDPVTWPPQKQEVIPASGLSVEEQEKQHIEDSKYETS